MDHTRHIDIMLNTILWNSHLGPNRGYQRWDLSLC